MWEDYGEANLIIGITSVFLLARFLDEYPPILASLSGSKVTPHWTLLSHRDQLEYCSYKWPLTADSQFRSLFEFQKSKKFNVHTLADRFAFIDFDSGSVRVKNGSKTHLTETHGLNPHDADKIIELVRKLEGFVLCWPSVPSTKEYREFLKWIEPNEDFEKAIDFFIDPTSDLNAPLPKKAHGRPRQRDELGAAYLKLFPNGHKVEAKTWKEARIEVENFLGRQVNDDTLKRGAEEALQKAKGT